MEFQSSVCHVDVAELTIKRESFTGRSTSTINTVSRLRFVCLNIAHQESRSARWRRLLYRIENGGPCQIHLFAFIPLSPITLCWNYIPCAGGRVTQAVEPWKVCRIHQSDLVRQSAEYKFTLRAQRVSLQWCGWIAFYKRKECLRMTWVRVMDRKIHCVLKKVRENTHTHKNLNSMS